MSAPNPQNVRIRLEIDVPTGGVSPAMLFEKGGLNPDRYSMTVPPAGQPACIRPVSGSSLGSFAFTVTYLTPFPVDVRALGYPDSIYPGFNAISPCPPTVVAGKQVAAGKWEWSDTYSNRVPGADHSATGILDRATIWKDFGLGLVFDGSVNLLGVTEGLGYCSGSGSTMDAINDLSSAEMLLISVGDGPCAGRHPAKRSSSREWIAQVGKERWTIVADPHEKLIIHTGRRTISHQAISSNPFMATFPGEAFGTKHDVVVTVP